MRRMRVRAQQREAVRPMSDARPMVDPNQSANHYLNGRNPADGFGR